MDAGVRAGRQGTRHIHQPDLRVCTCLAALTRVSDPGFRVECSCLGSDRTTGKVAVGCQVLLTRSYVAS